MGYTTEFKGNFQLDHPLFDSQWRPTANGRGVEWNGHEKFYRYVEWLQYLIVHFFVRWGYQLSGTVTWQGETPSDRGQIIVVNNEVVQPEQAEALLAIATTPIAVPLSVWQGLYAVHITDPTALVSWSATLHQAINLGYLETAGWIEANLSGQYGAGVERGFLAQETGAVFVPTCCPMGTWVS